MIISINNLLQFIIVLSLSLVLVLITKTKFYFDKSFQKQTQQVNNIENNNLTLEKVIIFSLQFFILLLNQVNYLNTYLNIFILILHFIICLSFLIKKNEQIKIWSNLFNIKFLILITIIACQLLLLAWEIHNIIFDSINNFGWITLFYIIFLFMTFKFCNNTFFIIKYLIFNTYKILTTKKNDNFYFNQKKIINFNSKVTAISSLWNFEHLKNLKKLKLTNVKEKSKKIIKNNLIIFIISCQNLFHKNTIKTQNIIINGWKISLIE